MAGLGAFIPRVRLAHIVHPLVESPFYLGYFLIGRFGSLLCGLSLRLCTALLNLLLFLAPGFLAGRLFGRFLLASSGQMLSAACITLLKFALRLLLLRFPRLLLSAFSLLGTSLWSGRYLLPLLQTLLRLSFLFLI